MKNGVFAGCFWLAKHRFFAKSSVCVGIFVVGKNFPWRGETFLYKYQELL